MTSDNICDTTDRYGNGGHPSTLTMCGECEGTGFMPPDTSDGNFSKCVDCKGTGRRYGRVTSTLVEFVDGFYRPLAFAAFWWREYGWSPNGDGGVKGAFMLEWNDRRNARRLFKNLFA